MAVTAGRLEWEVDVKAADAALRKVEELGRKMDRALRVRPTGGTGLEKIGRDATKATSEVDKLAQWFQRLQGQFRSGRLTLDQYQQGLRNVSQSIEQTRKRVDLTSREWGTLGTTMRRVQSEQATLTSTTAQVNARVRSLVNEVRVLRNEWRRTGQQTEQTKARLDALQKEMRELGDELRKTDGGWERFNAQIAQLSVAGRSAEATVAGMEGRMSRLGLASQVQLGVQQQLVGQMYRFGPAGAIAGQSLGFVAGNMGTLSVGTLAAAGGVLAVAGAAVSLTRRGIPQIKELQSALRVLIASGEELTESELVDELERIREAAGAAGDLFARGEMATALAELVKAGVDLGQAMDVLAPAMQLAAVTGQDLNETSQLLLGNLRQFNLDASQAGRVADSLAAADLAAAESAKELSEGMAVVGPVAAAAGFQFEEVLGILVELSNKGMGAADIAATGLRSTLSALLDPTKKAREVLDSLGVSLEDADGKARPLQEVLYDLVDAFAGNEEAAQAAAKVFDTRAITAIINITRASSELAVQLRNAAGAAGEYADVVTDDNLAAAQEKLNKALDDLAATFTSAFADDIADAATALSDVVRWIDALSRSPNIRRTIEIIVEPVADDIRDKGFWKAMLDLEAIMPPEAAERVYQFLGLSSKPFTGSGGRPSTGAVGTLGPVGPVPNFTAPGNVFGPLPNQADADGVDTVTESMAELIAQAARLKRNLDAATNPEDWIRATEQVDAFKDSSEAAATAWQAVVATWSGKGKEVRTPMDVFADLAEDGTKAERTAAAFGDTLEASLESAQTRAGLVRTAITELINDFDFDPASAEVQFLVTRLLELEAEILRIRREIDAEQTAQERQERAARESRDRIVASMRDATARGIIAERERNRLAGLVPSEAEVQAALEAMERIGQSMADATQRGIDAARERQARQNAVRGLAAGVAPSLVPLLEGVDDIVPDDVVAAVESGVRIIQSLNDATEAGIAAAEERAEAERLLGIAIARRRFAETDRQLLSNQADEEAEAMALRHAQAVFEATRAQDRYNDSLRFGGQAGRTYTEQLDLQRRALQLAAREGISLTEALDRLVITERELAAVTGEAQSVVAPSGRWIFGGEVTGETIETAEAIRTLQVRIQRLVRQGFDPASEAVQELVRRINELQLRAALDELREEGLGGISDFTRRVLELNGVLPEASDDVETFADKLRTLSGVTGNDVAAGLADILDGIKLIGEAAGDAETLVEGLTLAVTGAASIVESLRSGDGVGIARSLVGLAGEGIGQLAGIPGLGQLATAAFDLGHQIVLGISDAFTGDSQAARAIREGLTPALTAAFTQGIINGVRGAEGWQEGLRDGVKLVFLQSLVDAFVQGAIIQTYLAPLLVEYSKLLAAGNTEAAKAYLQTTLGPALEEAYAAAEDFVMSIPPWLAPSGGSSGAPGVSPDATPTILQLPTALTTQVSAPSWANDFNLSVGRLSGSIDNFADIVQTLRDQGITVTVNTTAGASTAAVAA